MNLKIFVAIAVLFVLACGSQVSNAPAASLPVPKPTGALPLRTGAERMEEYLPLLKDKTVALVVNHTSTVGLVHLADTLRARGIAIKAIFAPEHGFRGAADAGEKIKDGKDPATGIPILSLYGQKRKPSVEDLAGVDWVIFDIQDVGVRYYTYISTMHHVMEACAENGKPLMILDRPNPNGHYVDGPILQKGFESFVGMHPVPIVHGMTVGEYAQMLNGEGWLPGGLKCELRIIACSGYDHKTFYTLPARPSPNLPDMRSIYLYPSTCLFEGTPFSEGRGTPTPFQVYGHPDSGTGDYYFTPQSVSGAAKPKLLGQRCRGYDLSATPLDELRRLQRVDLSHIIRMYQAFPDKENFFLKSNFFDKLAGNSALREQIKAGKSEADIRAGWQDGLERYRTMRKPYLLYEDF
ncbi:MAG: DUF1343 domain-containing protein [Saprospiraceae bacterium]|nr:DUF1343 domain-containing protein [Saprospiraceae bacterium]